MFFYTSLPPTHPAMHSLYALITSVCMHLPNPYDYKDPTAAQYHMEYGQQWAGRNRKGGFDGKIIIILSILLLLRGENERSS